MGRGQDKRKTLVINVVTKKEIEFESRLDASKFTGLKRKLINSYMKTGYTYNKMFKFKDIK
ncbi:hypothetical protein [Paeniclostridium hominis]|uniref:hypothetical protein n=1 Tax=Paeniclostridium hominis TaxID=2764329 RepID=UPI0022E8C918|nr:hypothetical protein [Paeniclostridium hominis]